MPGPDDDLRSWLATWGALVASVDLDGAESLFDGAVVGFGTRADVAVGLAQLRSDQWGRVWPAISEFSFDVHGAQTHVSDDATQGVIWTTWSSTGRRGRATIVLRRDGATGTWLGVHTHFSLVPVEGG